MDTTSQGQIARDLHFPYSRNTRQTEYDDDENKEVETGTSASFTFSNKSRGTQITAQMRITRKPASDFAERLNAFSKGLASIVIIVLH